MKLTLMAVGHKTPDWIEAGCREYLRRLPRGMDARLCEIRPEPREGKRREQLLAAEMARIRQNLKALFPYRLVVLDEKGQNLTTLEFAERFAEWRVSGDNIVLLIGGADGLDADLKREAAESLRLSSLTFPHHLARLVLCEQIYRAMSVLEGHPYHREG
ncbi:MAG: 23S rRNA (pseudouridine(1915)-N(3))-methyltransferase RlmH [Zoogloeaceae bacterium]|jgi:23S rRNA (pseudouridine1915-N3)-methyltransferase|nr:23S rRNA (pseudouridine(1915)-N(3))-methyltransferase RlmH [Zoogloeaceae bacterium]